MDGGSSINMARTTRLELPVPDCGEFAEQLLEFRVHSFAANYICVRPARYQRPARLYIRKNQRRHVRAVMSGKNHVSQIGRAVAEELGAQRSRRSPRCQWQV